MITITGGQVSAGQISSAGAADGQVATADGAGGVAWGGPDKITLSPRDQVVLLGDSVTVNYGSYLATNLGVAWMTSNAGIAGNATDRMLVRLSYAVSASTKYIVVLGGVNDVNGGALAAAVEANLQAIYTAAHNAGLKVVAALITPWKNYSGWTAGKQVITDEINTWIQTTATGINYIVDTYSPMEDSPGSDTLKTAYDSGDGLHTNAAGSAALASAIYTGATWTPVVTAGTIVTAGGTVNLNQNVMTTDSPTFNNLGLQTSLQSPWIIASVIRPIADSIHGIEIYNETMTGTPIVTVDTINKRVGINQIAPSAILDINGNPRFGQGSGPAFATIGSSGDSASLIVTRAGYEAWSLKTGSAAAATGLVISNTSNTNVVTMLNASGNVGMGVVPTANLHLSASTTARASLRIPDGTAPTAPNDGDIWAASGHLYARLGGVTKEFTLV